MISLSRRLLSGLAASLLACTDTPVTPPAVETCATPITLRVGEVREFSGASALECIVVASDAAPSDVLFIAANATAVQDDLRESLVRATLGGGVAAATASVTPAPARRAAIATGSLSRRDAGDSLSVAVEAEIRAQGRRQLAGRSLNALAASRPAAPSTVHARTPIPTPVLIIGDTVSLRVGRASSGDVCVNFAAVRGVVRAVSQHATFVQDVSAPSGGFTSADFAALASEFDAVTYPTVSAWFGTPSDVNNDSRITILFTPEINRLTPMGSLGFVGGFFLQGDLLARDIPSQNYRCPASNEQEILYLLAPDPNGTVNSNRFSVDLARESARGTIAHELQHMINQGVRQANGAASREVDWLNEGLSHFAEEVVGRAVRGFADNRRLVWNDVLRDLDDFDSFFRQNIIRLTQWMDRPDLASPVSQRAVSDLASRGAAWALVRYAVDRFGGSDPRAFVRRLVRGPQVDLANLTAQTGIPFAQFLPGYLVAVHGGVPNAGAANQFTSWDIRDVFQSSNGGEYPLRASAFPVERVTSVPSGSGSYFLLSRGARAAPATFRMLSSDGQPIGFPGARVYVTRIR